MNAKYPLKFIGIPLLAFHRALTEAKVFTVNPTFALGKAYSFYLKPGKSEKVLVYFNGGGACWNYGIQSCLDRTLNAL